MGFRGFRDFRGFRGFRGFRSFRGLRGVNWWRRLTGCYIYCHIVRTP